MPSTAQAPAFLAALSAAEATRPEPTPERWLFVPYDQLSRAMGLLAEGPSPARTGVVLVESVSKGRRRPYHKQKLALVLANTRHFAIECAAAGHAVRHVATLGGYADALRLLRGRLGAPLVVQRPAERELRAELAPLVADGALTERPHPGWLTTPEDFTAGAGAAPPWRMDAFYRHVRRRTGVLMDDAGKPLGGRFSFDGDNRKPWRPDKGDPAVPEPPAFAPDAVTREVAELVDAAFADHPGAVDLAHLPATADDAEVLWAWALDACLPTFGPFEDAMSTRSTGLFHTRISPLMNLHRLRPARVLDDVLARAERLPLASLEGFVRQVLGWREFVHHTHEATDGFRAMPTGDKANPRKRLVGPVATLERPADGGQRRWAEVSGAAPHRPSDPPEGVDGGANAAFLVRSDLPLPPAFWGRESGLRCLDTVVADVWEEAYSHHITRLMILANLGALIGVRPRELTDWFWVAYADAYDWVVEPNVLGMGLFALGEAFTTKPYVSGSAYINKMSDYCGGCAFHPKKTCPITPLYWAFLARHREALDGNMRVAMPLRSLAKRSEARRARDEAVAAHVRERLAAGEPVTPSSVEAAAGPPV